MDKETLLKPRLPEDDVEIPGVGTVRVRGLSRGEVLRGQGLKGVDLEAYMLAAGMVDPPMTRDEVKQWQAASPAGELEPVTDVISRLSGLDEGAAKSDVPEVRDDSGD
ncbi:MAG TPA: hypothetical protein VGQ92_18200 [Actinoplanes sp.]|jgi:hypothetical protein|nr:hypothetical protein [Actinoplanes sp.]